MDAFFVLLTKFFAIFGLIAAIVCAVLGWICGFLGMADLSVQLWKWAENCFELSFEAFSTLM